jgi:hypothetical protein
MRQAVLRSPMKNFFLIAPLFGVIMGGCFSGCASSKGGITTVSRPGKVLTPPIRTVQKFNPLWALGNADDPEPPDWYRPGSPNRRWLWQMRNPLHNFTFYVVGVSDKPTTRTGRYPSNVFAPDGGWNWAFARHRFVPLPFVSFDGTFCRFYGGWRESGNLGFKLNFSRAHRTPATPTPELSTAAATLPVSAAGKSTK